MDDRSQRASRCRRWDGVCLLDREGKGKKEKRECVGAMARLNMRLGNYSPNPWTSKIADLQAIASQGMVMLDKEKE
jgi:hypothetical protein